MNSKRGITVVALIGAAALGSYLWFEPSGDPPTARDATPNRPADTPRASSVSTVQEDGKAGEQRHETDPSAGRNLPPGYDPYASNAGQRPESGPDLLWLMKIERGGNLAALQMARLTIKHLQSLPNPNQDEIQALSHELQALPELEAKLAKQQAAIDAFDVNAPPPVPLAPNEGPPTPVGQMLELKPDVMESIGLGDRISPKTFAAAKGELAKMDKVLAGLTLPAGSKGIVQTSYATFLEALQNSQSMQDKKEAARLLADSRKAFLDTVREAAGLPAEALTPARTDAVPPKSPFIQEAPPPSAPPDGAPPPPPSTPPR